MIYNLFLYDIIHTYIILVLTFTIQRSFNFHYFLLQCYSKGRISIEMISRGLWIERTRDRGDWKPKPRRSVSDPRSGSRSGFIPHTAMEMPAFSRRSSLVSEASRGHVCEGSEVLPVARVEREASLIRLLWAKNTERWLRMYSYIRHKNTSNCYAGIFSNIISGV